MNLARLPKNLVVLVAESDPHERKRLEMISPSLGATLRIVRDSEEAIDYLCGHAPYFTREMYPFPDLLIFNLRMPGISGLELLQWVNRESDCASLPRIVMDTQQNATEVNKAYQLGASTAFVRPMKTDALRETLEIIISYWVKAALPFVRHC